MLTCSDMVYRYLEESDFSLHLVLQAVHFTLKRHKNAQWNHGETVLCAGVGDGAELTPIYVPPSAAQLVHKQLVQSKLGKNKLEKGVFTLQLSLLK